MIFGQSPLWFILGGLVLIAGLSLWGRWRWRRVPIIGSSGLTLALVVAGWILWQPAIVNAAGQHLNPTGVPITANWTLVLTKNLDRQGMVLDANATPLLFVAHWATTPADIRTLQTHVQAVPGLHRPLMVISTFFHRPARAVATTTHWVRQAHVTLPVVVQEGAPSLYVATVPTLVTAVHGRIVQYHGWSAILAHLRTTIQIPAPKPLHLAPHPTTHRS
jgi:hypothetical protein